MPAWREGRSRSSGHVYRGNRAAQGKASRPEIKLCLAANKLRNNMDAAEYKHVVRGLIFRKYISDSFEEMRSRLVAGQGDPTCDLRPATAPPARDSTCDRTTGA